MAEISNLSVKINIANCLISNYARKNYSVDVRFTSSINIGKCKAISDIDFYQQGNIVTDLFSLKSDVKTSLESHNVNNQQNDYLIMFWISINRKLPKEICGYLLLCLCFENMRIVCETDDCYAIVNSRTKLDGFKVLLKHYMFDNCVCKNNNVNKFSTITNDAMLSLNNTLTRMLNQHEMTGFQNIIKNKSQIELWIRFMQFLMRRNFQYFWENNCIHFNASVTSIYQKLLNADNFIWLLNYNVDNKCIDLYYTNNENNIQKKNFANFYFDVDDLFAKMRQIVKIRNVSLAENSFFTTDNTLFQLKNFTVSKILKPRHKSNYNSTTENQYELDSINNLGGDCTSSPTNIPCDEIEYLINKSKLDVNSINLPLLDFTNQDVISNLHYSLNHYSITNNF